MQMKQQLETVSQQQSVAVVKNMILTSVSIFGQCHVV